LVFAQQSKEMENGRKRKKEGKSRMIIPFPSAKSAYKTVHFLNALFSLSFSSYFCYSGTLNKAQLLSSAWMKAVKGN
jgi:hypothetical protein